MKFYDLHVHVDVEKLEEVVELAERLEYSGIGLTVASMEDLKRLKEKIKKINSNLDLVTCIEIQAKGVKEMKREISKFRKTVDIITIFGGEYNINRAAVEDERVDILSHPEYMRKDSGVDEIIARSAWEKNVTIEINFHEILETYRKIRAHILNHLSRNVDLCKKYDAPIVITSGANDKWGMRDPRELAAIGQLLGMNLNESMKSVSLIPESIIENNRRKLKGYR